MEIKKIRIALDGPSGAGKSTIAKMVAEKLGIVYVDTGALYRTVGLYSIENGIAETDIDDIIESLSKIDIRLAYEDGTQKVYLNGSDVGDRIRTPLASKYASYVSKIPEVRAFLLDVQRSIAAEGGVIMDGRDIGTVIMPDADVKLFMEASAKARAHRRYEELMQKGDTSTEEEVLKDIIKRDSNDQNRAASPAIPADDAIFLDNSEYTPEETLNVALKIIKDKLSRSL